MCEDAQGNKYMVKAFNSSDNFLKLEEVTSSPIPFIQIECSNEYLEKRTLWFRVHLRKLFSSFNSVFSPSCISFVLKRNFWARDFRNYCCGETGKSNALHCIKASGGSTKRWKRGKIATVMWRTSQLFPENVWRSYQADCRGGATEWR